jgi:polyisoprenoid-binding protein YceI
MTCGPCRPRLGRAAALLVAVVVCWPPAVGAQAVWQIDAAASRLVVHVFRKGLLSPALHDHHFVADRWHGRIVFDPAQPSAIAVDVVVEAASLRDEQPKLSPADRREVETQVRSPRFLDAGRYPEIRFTADRLEEVERAGDRPLTIKGRLVGHLTIRDTSAPVEVSVTAEIDGPHLRARGEAVVRQSQFGIRPLSRLLGAIGVEDRVRVDIVVDAVAERPSRGEPPYARRRFSKSGYARARIGRARLSPRAISARVA